MSFETLFNDLFEYILSFLTPKDILQIKLLNVAMSKRVNRELLEKFIIPNIENTFSDIFGEKTDEFMRIIESLGAFIAGDFIMDSILGLKQNTTRISIYLNIPDTIINKKGQIFWNGINVNDFHEESAKKDIILQEFKQLVLFLRQINGMKNIYYSNDHLETIYYVENYYKKYGDKLVDIYLANNMDQLQKFNSQFIFDICQNNFCVKGSKKILSICNLDGIINQMAEFKAGSNIFHSITQYLNYKKRGFNISNSMIYKDEVTKKTSIHPYSLFVIRRWYNSYQKYMIVEGDIALLKDYWKTFGYDGECLIFNTSNFRCDDECPIRGCDPNNYHFHNANQYLIFIVV